MKFFSFSSFFPCRQSTIQCIHIQILQFSYMCMWVDICKFRNVETQRQKVLLANFDTFKSRIQVVRKLVKLQSRHESMQLPIYHDKKKCYFLLGNIYLWGRRASMVESLVVIKFHSDTGLQVLEFLEFKCPKEEGLSLSLITVT